VIAGGLALADLILLVDLQQSGPDARGAGTRRLRLTRSLISGLIRPRLVAFIAYQRSL
jgi:hypothetical protein